MSDEDKNKGGDAKPDENKGDKHPETVSWSEYVGVKESLGKKADAAEQKVQSLEEQLNNAMTPEKVAEIEKERDSFKEKYETANTELETVKNTTLTEKREALVKLGVPKEKADGMNREALDAALMMRDYSKPGADINGGGSGGGTLVGKTADQLAHQAYSN